MMCLTGMKTDRISSQCLSRFDDLIQEFIREPADDIIPLSGGHINTSFLVKGREDYVLQRLSRRLFADHLRQLEHNYLQYIKAFQSLNATSASWCYPEWIKDRDGLFFHTDEKGDIWRMYRYIPSEPFTKQRDEVFAAGHGLGRLHAVLCGIGDIWKIDTIFRLHDLGYHYERYRLLDDERRGRDKKLDRSIADNIEDMLRTDFRKDFVIHGDAKVSNMIFENGKVKGFIDLDTIMEGSVFDDIADCARSCCVDDDGKPSRQKMNALLSGYETGAGRTLSEEDREAAYAGVIRNMFMLGIRYYTDHLSKEGYFLEEYPGRNLEKARNLIDVSAFLW